MTMRNVKTPQYSDIKAEAYGIAAGILAQGGSRASAASAVTDAADAFLQHISTVLVNLGPKLAMIACGPGCTTCCLHVVGLTVAEGERLTEFLGTLKPDQQDEILSRAKDVAARGKGLGPRQWWDARLPCPLLDEAGACIAHSVRPLPCRGYNSADRDACLRMGAGEPVTPPVLSAQIGVYGHAQMGLAQALVDAGTAQPLTTLVEFLAHSSASMPKAGQSDKSEPPPPGTRRARSRKAVRKPSSKTG